MEIKTSDEICNLSTSGPSKISFEEWKLHQDKKWIAIDDVKKMIVNAISIYGDDILEENVKLLDFFNNRLEELKKGRIF